MHTGEDAAADVDDSSPAERKLSSSRIFSQPLRRFQIFSGKYKILLLLTPAHEKACCCSINNAAVP
jgi:hypothetical protein